MCFFRFVEVEMWCGGSRLICDILCLYGVRFYVVVILDEIDFYFCEVKMC